MLDWRHAHHVGSFHAVWRRNEKVLIGSMRERAPGAGIPSLLCVALCCRYQAMLGVEQQLHSKCIATMCFEWLRMLQRCDNRVLPFPDLAADMAARWLWRCARSLTSCVDSQPLYFFAWSTQSRCAKGCTVNLKAVASSVVCCRRCWRPAIRDSNYGISW